MTGDQWRRVLGHTLFVLGCAGLIFGLFAPIQTIAPPQEQFFLALATIVCAVGGLLIVLARRLVTDRWFRSACRAGAIAAVGLFIVNVALALV